MEMSENPSQVIHFHLTVELHHACCMTKALVVITIHEPETFIPY